MEDYATVFSTDKNVELPASVPADGASQAVRETPYPIYFVIVQYFKVLYHHTGI